MKQLTTEQKATKDKHRGVVALYASGHYTTEQIAKNYNISTKQVQRIARTHNVIRTQAEANKLMAPLKRYQTIPLHLRVKRKQISNKQRYEIIFAHPFCSNCGMRPEDGVRLEVDHVDEDAENNVPENLQVLCTKCNTGKSHTARFGATYATN